MREPITTIEAVKGILDLLEEAGLLAGVYETLQYLPTESTSKHNPYRVNIDLKYKYRRFKRFYYKYEYYIKPLNKVFPSVKLYHRKIL